MKKNKKKTPVAAVAVAAVVLLTGTILRSIDMKNVDDNWYYEIIATAQLITKDDLGLSNGPGFYDAEEGTLEEPYIIN